MTATLFLMPARVAPAYAWPDHAAALGVVGPGDRFTMKGRMMVDNESGGKRDIRAGKIFLQMIENDPAYRRRSEATAAAIAVFGTALKAVAPGGTAKLAGDAIASHLAPIRQQHEQDIARIAAEYRVENEKIDREWEKEFGIACPKSIEDWKRLAARAGIDPNFVLGGNYTLREIAPVIEGYLQGQKDNAAVVLGANECPSGNPTRNTTITEVAGLLGIDRRTLKKSQDIWRKSLSDRKWVFDLDQIEDRSPEAADKLKPE